MIQHPCICTLHIYIMSWDINTNTLHWTGLHTYFLMFAALSQYTHLKLK